MIQTFWIAISFFSSYNSNKYVINVVTETRKFVEGKIKKVGIRNNSKMQMTNTSKQIMMRFNLYDFVRGVNFIYSNSISRLGVMKVVNIQTIPR